MCGRYDLNAIATELAKRFQVSQVSLPASLRDVSNASVARDAGDLSLQGIEHVSAGAANATVGRAGWRPRYNMAPGQRNPVVIKDGQGHNQLEFMQWGLVPSWSREPKVGYSTINARAETVASKPAFRKLLSGKRCLVPATGYFEWAASSGAGGKQPYRVQVTGNVTGDDNGEDQVLAMAGLYDVWKGQYGEPLLTYTIITTEAIPGIRALHERMPVILSREDEDVWLDPGMNETERLVSLLRPYPDTQIRAYRVGRGVNNPINDRVELIRAA